MSKFFEWTVALGIVIGFGLMGAAEFEDQQRAAAHKKEAVAAARKEAVHKAKWAELDKEARRLTSYDRIVDK